MKKIIMCLVGIVLSALYVDISLGATYYVTNGGNNARNGLSSSNAWATVARVNDFAESPGFSDGDIIQFKRGDTFVGETIGYDTDYIAWGNIDGLTFQAYGTGDKPKFRNLTTQAMFFTGSARGNKVSNLTVKDLDISGAPRSKILNGCLLEIYEVDGVVVDSIYGNGHLPGKPHYARSGIQLTSCTGDLVIKNSEIFNNGPADMPTIGEDYHSLHIRIGEGGKQPNSLEIYDNIAHDVNADCLQIGNYQGPEVAHVYNNTFYNFGENAIDLKNTSYVDVYNNTLYRGDFGLGGTGGGKSTLVYTASGYTNVPDHNKVYNNYFGDTNYHQIQVLRCDDCSIYGNFFENADTGIAYTRGNGMEIYDNVFNVTSGGSGCIGTECSGIRFDDRGKKTNTVIRNNTFYLNSNKHLYAIGYQRSSGNKGTTIRNNIFNMARNSSSVFPLFVGTDSGELPIVTDNIYMNEGHTNRVKWTGSVYDSTELSAFRRAVDSGAVFTRPVYLDKENGDFSLDYDETTGLDGVTSYGATKNMFVTPARMGHIVGAVEGDIVVPTGFKIK